MTESGSPPDAPALHDRAIADLRFIRQTMADAATFTDVPGWGLVGIGIVGMVTAPMAALQPTPGRWLGTWLAAAVVALALGVVAMIRKLRRRLGAIGISAPARSFLLGLAPILGAAAILTVALVRTANEALLVGTWLLLYGAAITTAGARSVRAVPLMGLAFLALGATALLVRSLPGDVMMAVGFGGVHLVVGVAIARRHDG